MGLASDRGQQRRLALIGGCLLLGMMGAGCSPGDPDPAVLAQQGLEPWSPEDLDLLAWYKATAGVVPGDLGTAEWHDQSGNGQHVTQDIIWSRPQFNATGWNGIQPTLTFRGGDLLRLPAWTSSPAGENAAFTVLAVMRSAEPQNTGVVSVWDPAGVSAAWARLTTANGLTFPDLTRIDGFFNKQIYTGPHDLGTGRHVVAWRYSPETQTLKLTVDGATATSDSYAPLVGIASGAFLIGSLTWYTGYFKGDISELAVVNGSISDEQVQFFTDYARNAWSGLPTEGSTDPCLDAGGQPTPSTTRCDDGEASTFADHCSSGTCVGTVPGAGNPGELLPLVPPLAWFHAGVTEVAITDGTVATWFDRSPSRRHVQQTYAAARPTFNATGWNENKPTVTFNDDFLRRNIWAGAPEGNAAFTVLAVFKPAAAQSSAIASWWNTATYGKVSCQLENAGGTFLRLVRANDASSQGFTGGADLGTSRHVAAWRFSPEISKLTLDGTTVSSTSLTSITDATVNALLIGTLTDQPNGGRFAGDLSELAVIPSFLSDQAVADFSEYAQTEWGGLTLCQPACDNQVCGAADGCGGSCLCGPGESGCIADSGCSEDLICVSGTCVAPTCSVDPVLAGCGYPGAPCGPCCNLSHPFGSMTRVLPGVTSVDGFTLSSNGLTAYVSRRTTTQSDLFRTNRTSVSAAFGGLTRLSLANSPSDEHAPFLSNDGLSLYFHTNNTANGEADLVVSQRESLSAVFSVAQAIPGVNSAAIDEDPYFTPDMQLLAFASDRPTAERDLYWAKRNLTGFDAPVKIPGVNSTASEMRPVVSRNGLRLYFGSRRAGFQSDTDGDIWLAERADTTSSFGPPTNLAPLNWTGAEFPVALSPDGCTLYLASNREHGASGVPEYEIYQARRQAALDSVTIQLNVTGGGTGSVGAPFNCAIGNVGTCSAQQPFGSYPVVFASRQARWSGLCAPNGPSPSTDGFVSFSVPGTCNVSFPAGPGETCLADIDCTGGLFCFQGHCNTCQNGCSVCGDAIRDPVNEECDDGPGTGADACTADCRVTDVAVAPAPRVEGERRSRTLGFGRHPLAASAAGTLIAYTEVDGESQELRGALFDERGQALLELDLGAGAFPSEFADPSIAAVPGDRFVVAWNDLDHGSLDIALRSVQVGEATSTGVAVLANATTAGAQQGPDVLWTGSELVVAWASEFENFARRFSADLVPLGEEQALGVPGEVAGSVVLANFAGSWAAAFRALADDGAEILRVQAGALDWSVGPFLPGAAEERPALIELDASHLLIVYSEGFDPLQTGTPAVTRLRAAVLDTAAPGPTASFLLESAVEPYATDDSIARAYPTLARVGTKLFLGWETESVVGSALSAEVWIQELTWSTATGLVQAAEHPVPLSAGREGAQFAVAFSASPLFPEGALSMVWEHHSESWPYAARPDILFSLRPVPFVELQ